METKTKKNKKAIECEVNKIMKEHNLNRKALLQEQKELLEDGEEYRLR